MSARVIIVFSLSIDRYWPDSAAARPVLLHASIQIFADRSNLLYVPPVCGFARDAFLDKQRPIQY
jgi:hypothetical protein